MVNTPLDAALDYGRRGWPVFPCRLDKTPYTRSGFKDATTDGLQILAWNWDAALVGIATGKPSGLVVLDVDVKSDKAYGPDSLEALGVTFHPNTMTAHTESGGYHVLFQWPGYEVPCSAGKLGSGLDIRGDGGYIVAPPGPGRFWDPHFGLDTPLAPMPGWLIVKEPQRTAAVAPKLAGALSPYCAAALDRARQNIIDAPCGQQEETLNRECFNMGTLVDGHGMPAGFALRSLLGAAAKVPNYDRRRPWYAKELEKKVEAAFNAGLRQPREKS